MSAALAIAATVALIWAIRRLSRPRDHCAGCGAKIAPPDTYFCDTCWTESWW